MDIPEVDRVAVLQDPQGAVFGIKHAGWRSTRQGAAFALHSTKAAG